MWLISARALDKVGPSICVFSASIGRIMHNTGLIVASRITVRAIPVVVIEMNGMPMARNFPFGQKYQLRRGKCISQLSDFDINCRIFKCRQNPQQCNNFYNFQG